MGIILFDEMFVLSLSVDMLFSRLVPPVFPGAPAQAQPVSRRNLRAHVPVLETRSEHEAHVQAVVSFPETQPHHVLVRNRQTAAHRLANVIASPIISSRGVSCINFVETSTSTFVFFCTFYMCACVCVCVCT